MSESSLDRMPDSVWATARGRPTTKMWAEAETALATAKMIHPDSPDVACQEGELAAALRRWSEAETAFERCVTLDNTRYLGWDGIAQARWARGNRVGVEDALRRSFQLRPDVWTTSHNLGVFLARISRFVPVQLFAQATKVVFAGM